MKKLLNWKNLRDMWLNISSATYDTKIETRGRVERIKHCMSSGEIRHPLRFAVYCVCLYVQNTLPQCSGRRGVGEASEYSDGKLAIGDVSDRKICHRRLSNEIDYILGLRSKKVCHLEPLQWKMKKKFSPMEFKGAVIYQAGYPPGVDMAGVWKF